MGLYEGWSYGNPTITAHTYIRPKLQNYGFWN